MPKALYITTEGDIKEVSPFDGKSFSYKELRAFVDGMVEIVPLPSGRELVCNEEGKLNSLDINQKATEIWKQEYPIEKYPNNNDELVVGNVLITDAEFLK
jgi:hypothetical protein